MSRNRVVGAAMVVAAVIGIPGSALAFGSASSGSKPTSAPTSTAPTATSGSKPTSAPTATAPTATAPASKASGPTDLSGLAASAGITESQLEAGLVAAKQAGGGNTPSAVAAFARATGVSAATAQRVVSSAFSPQVNPNPTSPSALAALANELGVSTGVAQSAVEQLEVLARAEGIDASSPAFAAIAHRLGVSPTRLAAALPLIKTGMRTGS